MSKNQRLIIKMAIVIVLVICIISFIIFLARGSLTKTGEFTAPKMDNNAILGKPTNMEKECMYQEAKVSNEYIVSLCAVPYIRENRLNIYFASSEGNKGLMLIKVLDSQNNVIGESGLINPNSYIKEVLLSKDLKDKEKITIRVMHYEKETYYSLGEVKLDLLVRK